MSGKIRGIQIKDESVDSVDIASGSIKAGETSPEIISGEPEISSVDTSSDRLLIWDATDSALKRVAPGNLGVGGGGSVAGSNTQVQFNNSSAFGGASKLLYDEANGRLKIGDANAPQNILDVYGNISNDYVAVIQNDQSSAGHVLKLATDGNGNGSNILEMEDGDNDIVFKARADGRFGFGPSGVNSMGAGTFVVGIDGGHTSDIAISKRLQHLGDSDTYLDFPSANTFNLVAAGNSFLKYDSGNILINNANADVDMKVMADDGSVILMTDASTNRVGIGTTAPGTLLDITTPGTPKFDTDVLTLTNNATAANMDGTGTAINFKQKYYDQSPGYDDVAKITARTDGDWTSTANTREGMLSFSISNIAGSMDETVRISRQGILVSELSGGTGWDGWSSLGNDRPFLGVLHGDDGTASPADKTSDFNVYLKNTSVTSNAFAGIGFDVTSNFSSQGIGAAIRAERDTAAGSTDTNRHTNLTFSTNPSTAGNVEERMRITHDGKLGVHGVPWFAGSASANTGQRAEFLATDGAPGLVRSANGAFWQNSDASNSSANTVLEATNVVGDMLGPSYYNTHMYHYAVKATPASTAGNVRRMTDSSSANNFTGQHNVLPAEGAAIIENLVEYVGLIVRSTGEYCRFDEPSSSWISGLNSITISEALPRVELTTTANDKSAFGVISNMPNEYILNPETGEYEQDQDGVAKGFGNISQNQVRVNAIGEGAVWIVNASGNLENGDYITTSALPGYGTKQADDLLHNYTVAKITQDCSFDLNSTAYKCEEFESGGETYRKAFVGCTYHCG